MRTLTRGIAMALLLFVAYTASAQITGVNTVPGTFATIEAAVTALNTFGVGAGGATINVAAGYTETPTAPLVLTITNNSPNAANPLVIQKSGVGANPLITAFTPGVSTTLDGIFILNGVDYVTIDGINLQDNAANTTATMQMEWGYALVKSSSANGAKSNTIKNCSVTLNRTNLASVGIYLGNHTSASTTALTVATLAGSSSFNRFYNNTIQDCYTGYSLTGYASPAPFDFYDQGNQIGKDGVSTRRSQVLNFGGGASTANGIFATNQNGLKVFGTYINGGTGTTTTTNGISLATGTNSSVDVYNDTITLTTSGTTSLTCGILNTMGGTGAGSVVNIYNNVITSCVMASATSAEFRGISHGATSSYTNIYNNTVSNNSIPGTGQVSGIYCSGGSVTLCLEMNIYNNTISNNTKTGTAGVFNCIYGNFTCYVIRTYGNTLTNNAAASTSGAVYGYYNFSVGIGEQVYNNTVTGLTGGTGETVALNVNAGPTTTQCDKEVYGNTINAITGNAAVGGILFDYGGVNTIYRNNIYNITTNGAGSSSYGIKCDAVSSFNFTSTIYNNFVSEIKAPVSTSAAAVHGIWILGSASSSFNIANNTVFLNAVSSSATTFGTSGITLGNNPLVIDLRNNIIVNLSTPGPSGGNTVALSRSTTTLTNLATTSGNNCLYAGTPAANRLIYTDGTNSDQTIQQFKNRVSPREQASFSELPPFINTAVSPYNLHLAAATPTQCESGGRTANGVTTDYDAQPRYPNPGFPTSGFAQAPDVGADEIGGNFNDIAAPYISYTPLTNSSVAATRACPNFASIFDPGGINNTAGTNPRLYYRKSTNLNTYNGNTNATDGWKYVEAGNATSPFSFTIDYTLLFGGSVTAGDIIQYFVVAQDLNGTPVVGINSGGFTTQPTSVNLTAANFPLNNTINQYTIVAAPLSGTINVGPSEVITSLTNAGGIFQAINSSVLSGNLVINVTGDLTAETGTVALNQWAEEGAGGYTVTIQSSAAVVRNIYGASAGAALIRFDGADRVNIDGRVASAGTYLMFRNTSNSAPTIGFLNDAQNNTVQYAIIESGNTATTTTLGGAIWIGTTTGMNGNDNNTISNCEIRDRSDVTGTPCIAINCVGSTTSVARYNDNCVFMNNNIHDWYLQNSGAQFAINIGVGNSGHTISGNSFYQTATRTHTASGSQTRAINISNSNTSAMNGGFVITGNFIGGGAPGATGADMAMTVSGVGVSQVFGGMSVITGLIPNSIQGNTIRGIDFTTNSPAAAATIWFGMNFGQGIHNIGTVTGNTIGSTTAPNSVKITINSGGAVSNFIAGILCAGTNSTFNIQNNNIGGISTGGSTTTGAVFPQLIQVQGNIMTPITISGNTIGSQTVSNSIISTTNAQCVYFGIRYVSNGSSAAPCTVTNNNILNITDVGTSPSSGMYGVLMVSAVGATAPVNVSNNNIRNIQYGGTPASPALGLLGISLQGYGGTGHTISGNTILTLTAVSTTAAQAYVAGIQSQGNSSGGTISNNRIGDLQNTNTGASPGIVGMYFNAGLSWTLTNNMVSVSNGSNTNLVDMSGIIEYMGTGSTMNLYYNSVYVGGGTNTGAFNTTCYGRGGSSNVTLRNNLLYNRRSGGTGAHVAIANASATPTLGWPATASNYNAFVTTDTTKIGVWFNAAYNMSGWRAMSGGDANSIWEIASSVTNTSLFVNFNTANLHVNTSTFPEALGTPVAGITTDYDGDPRSATTPTIGADELQCSMIVFTATSQTNPTCNGSNDGSATVGGTGGNGITYSWAPIGGNAATATNLPAGTYTVTISNICGNTGTVQITLVDPAVVSATMTSTPANCNGGTDGTATAAGTGGTGPYTYVWSSGGTAATESNLAMGNYTVTITDANSCTGTQTVAVTEPTALSTSTMQTDVSCNGGTNGDAMVMPTGGTPAYTYLWTSGGTNATESNLAAGTYTVTTTDANGCSRNNIVTITEPTAITASVAQTSPSCNGSTDGSVTISPSGGTPGYSYLWSSGGTNATETGLGDGSYTVTVTDANGCTFTSGATLTEPALVTATSVDMNPTTCSGADGSVDMTTAGGTGPYTYLWSNSDVTEDLAAVAAGTYTVTITDANGCTGTHSATLTDPSAPTVTYSEPVDTACAGVLPTPPFVLTAGSPAGGSWSGPGVTGNQFDASAANIGYNVITYLYTDSATGCSASAMDSIWVDICLGVSNPVADNGFTLYPNPNNGEFFVVLEETADVYVYDALGQLVTAQKVQGGTQHKIAVEASGAYMVTVVNANGNRRTQRVIVTK